MRVHETIVIESPQDIAVSQQKSIAEQRPRKAHSAAGAEGLGFTAVVDVNAEAAAVREMFFDHVAAMADEQDEVAQTASCERVDHQLEKRTLADRHHCLRHIAGEIAEASAEAAGEDRDFHFVTPSVSEGPGGMCGTSWLMNRSPPHPVPSLRSG